METKGFLKSSETPIKNGQQINDLLTAVFLPSEIALIEMKLILKGFNPSMQEMP